MISRISIKNFRGFNEFDVAVGPVTALMGPNNSGKTSVLQAIRFAVDALGLALESEKPIRPRGKNLDTIVAADGLLVDYTRLLPMADWRTLFLDRNTGAGTSIRVCLYFENDDPLQLLDVSLACASNDQLKLTVFVRSIKAAAAISRIAAGSKFVNISLREYLTLHAPRAVFVPPFYGAARAEEFRSRAMVDQLLGSGDQSHVVRNLVLQLEPTQFNQLNSFLHDTIGAKLVSRTTADEAQSVTQLSVTFRDSNGELELSAAGAGLVNMIALYSGLSRWRHETRDRTVLFLLDEPEAHLHPRLQAEMSARLATLVTEEFGAQLFLATHSVDILNRLWTTDGTLVRCDRQMTPSAVTLSTDAALFDDLASWVDLTPYTAINFLAGRRVVFCKGDDELGVLPKLAELLYRNDPKRVSAFRRWSLVKLDGASNAPIAGLLNRLLTSDAVRSGATDAEFLIELVLDRDYGRTPGVRSEESSAVVQQRTTVWSQHSLESLLVEPSVLTIWCRAFLGDRAPTNLDALVDDAATKADSDSELNRNAVVQLAATIANSEMKNSDGKTVGGETKFVRAQNLAHIEVSAEPRSWQRGKDRARAVLGSIREGLPKDAQSQFPTDVINLVNRARLDRIGNPRAAVPAEAVVLLDALTSR